MEAPSCPARDDRPARVATPRGVACPFCEGLLVPVRGAYRCVRCCFSICPGCDGSDVSDCGEAGV